jgi:hypothetical protein
MLLRFARKALLVALTDSCLFLISLFPASAVVLVDVE